MKWLAVWLLLTAVYLAVLLLCRRLGGELLFRPSDLPDLLLIPAAQLAALAALRVTAAHRRKR